MKTPKSQSFLHGALIIMMGTFISKFIGIFFRLLVGNIIGAEGHGYYGSAYSIYKPLYALSISGLPVALAKIITENAQNEKGYKIDHVFRVAQRLFMLIGVVLMGAMVVFSKQLAVFMCNPGAKLCIMALAPVAFFACLGGAYKGYYEGCRNMYPTAWSEAIEAVARLVFGTLFAVLGLKVGVWQFATTKTVFGMVVTSQHEAALICGAAGSLLGITVSCALGTIFLILRKGREEFPTPAVPRSERSTAEILRRIIAIAVPLCLGSIVFNVSGNIDARTGKSGLMQAMAANPHEFARMLDSLKAPVNDITNLLWGGYGLLLPLYNFVPAIMVSFGVSLLPCLAGAWSSRSHEEVGKHVETSLRVTNALAVSAGCLVALNAEHILSLIYSQRVAEMMLVAPCLRILGVGIIFTSLASTTNVILQATGRFKLPTLLMAGGVALKYIVNKILIPNPKFNIKGAAIGTLVCYFFIASVGLLLALKITRVKLDVKSVFLKPLLVGLCTLLVGFLCAQICSFFPSHSVAVWRFQQVIIVFLPILLFPFFLLFCRVLTEDDVLMFPSGEKFLPFLKKHRFLL
ncbi:MAG: polysaccharide biosynthesis C-terminal domain-containing protein [Oscillospiraceae bacterium]|nr:polysaccharide biosynthesis C-terminal domain-containing protein [Oscillospiraceae bacterium]